MEKLTIEQQLKLESIRNKKTRLNSQDFKNGSTRKGCGGCHGASQKLKELKARKLAQQNAADGGAEAKNAGSNGSGNSNVEKISR